MISPHATEPAAASGFTPAQTAAIADLVHEATAAAVDALRHELGRWHCYLALYLLGQIGLVLLAILVLQALRDPPPLRTAAREVNVHITQQPATAIQGEHRVNRTGIETYRGGTAAGTQNSLPIVSPGIAPPPGVQVVGVAAIRGPTTPSVRSERESASERWL